MGTGSHARMQRAQFAEYTRELLTMPGWSSLSIFCCQRAPALGWHTHVDNLSFLPSARPVPAKANFPARTWNWGIFSNYCIRIELQNWLLSFFCLFYLSSGLANLPILLWRGHGGHYRPFSACYFGSPRRQFSASVRRSLCHPLSGGTKAQ